MNEFKGRENITALVAELHEPVFNNQSGDTSIEVETIKAEIDETQLASVAYIQKLYPYLLLTFVYDPWSSSHLDTSMYIVALSYIPCPYMSLLYWASNSNSGINLLLPFPFVYFLFYCSHDC